jgi:hypothetical protein
MRPDRALSPGQPLSLRLAAGDELLCTSGLLQLATTGPWLGQAWAPPAHHVPAGQSWRASADLWVTLEGLHQPSLFRLLPGHRT